MMNAPLEYASNIGTRRSRLALVALAITAVAAAFLAISFLEGTTNTDLLGVLSLPLAVVGTTLTLIVALRKSSREVLIVASLGVVLAYWAAVVAIVPKLFASF